MKNNEAKAQMQREKLQGKYNRRFSRKPWLMRFQPLRQIFRHLSYLVQAASIAAGYYGALVAFQFLPWLGASIAVAITVLVAIEVGKRKASDGWWDAFFASRRGLLPLNWSAGAANLSFFALSFAISVGGMYFVATDFSPTAQLVGANADPEAQALMSERETLRASIAEHRTNRNSAGEIYWPSQQAIARLEDQVSDVNDLLKSKHGIYDLQNTAILTAWTEKNGFRLWLTVGLIILLEFLFEGMMAFASYYDLRYAIAMGYVKQQRSAPIRMNGTLKKAWAAV